MRLDAFDEDERQPAVTSRCRPHEAADRYDIPRGCAAGYLPAQNVLCSITDYSTQSGQPVTKHLVVEITRGRKDGRGSEG